MMSLYANKRSNPLFGMDLNDIYSWGIGESIPSKKRKLEPPKENLQNETLDEEETEKEDLLEDADGDNEIKKDVPKTKTKKPKTIERLAQLERERISHVRKEHSIHIYGSDIPPPIESFDQLSTNYGIAKKLIENLKERGFDTPTPIQMQAWSLMLKGRELLACAPTGSGKTAGFLVPIIHHLKRPKKDGFRAVIVAPTQELAKQTYRECLVLTEGLGLVTHTLLDIGKNKKKFGPDSSLKFDILVTTPNRLVFMLQEDQPLISLSNVEWLIVDESDRLFEDGKRGFRDQLAVIFQACNNAKVRRGMFSATFARDVEEWSKLNLDNLAMVCVGARNSACKDVSQELVFCGEDEYGKHMALFNILRQGYEPPCLIFVQTKERAKQLFKELLLDNRMVAAIHSDRPKFERDNLVKGFRERKIWILICTELLSRGIDFRGVNLVINYDFPPSVISYIHRVGRTGRAGHNGRAITFWTMQDKPLLRNVAQVMHDSGSDVPDWMLKLDKVTRKVRKKFTKNLPDRGFISEAAKHEALLKEKKKLRKKKYIERKKNKLHGQENSTDNSPKNIKIKKGSKNNKSILKKKLKRKKVILKN